MKTWLAFWYGIFKNNPIFRLVLGLCPTLAVTTSLENALGMGMAATFVLICSNGLVSALRKVIPAAVHIPCYIVIIATFVTAIDLLMQAYLPALSASLGIFIPLIVVNCIILGRAEAFASKNTVGAAALDGIFQGLGYTLVLIVMCIIRELLGSGTFGAGIFNGGEGLRVFPQEYGALLLIRPFGGFLTLGCLIALMQHFLRKSKAKAAAKEEEASK